MCVLEQITDSAFLQISFSYVSTPLFIICYFCSKDKYKHCLTFFGWWKCLFQKINVEVKKIKVCIKSTLPLFIYMYVFFSIRYKNLKEFNYTVSAKKQQQNRKQQQQIKKTVRLARVLAFYTTFDLENKCGEMGIPTQVCCI